MKIARTLIGLSLSLVLGVAACKSSETPPPAESTPASAPAEGTTEGAATPPPAEEKPAEEAPAPQR